MKDKLPQTSAGFRALIALFGPFIPVAAGVGFAAATAGRESLVGLYATAPFLAVSGLLSWVLGLRWYGLPALGLRGKRPLFAGIGFAVLGWVALLATRIYFVANTGIAALGLAQAFFYLLLFEAFCVQLWLFGLLFRAVSDWRGPLSGVLVSGTFFGLTALFLFGETAALRDAPTATQLVGVAFFLTYGFFYGLIRLRTGSLLGMVLVQAVQSATTWYLFQPLAPSSVDLRWTYGVSGLIFLIFIWRLWPHEVEDYRV